MTLRRAVLIAVWLCVVVCTIFLAGAVYLAESPQKPAQSNPRLYVEAVVVDHKGNVVRDMKASDFSVITDAGSRPVVAAIPLLRGPGAAESAQALSQGSGAGSGFHTESTRVVLFVVDQASLVPGDERRAAALVETCLGLLGFGDHVGLMVLPGPRGSMPMRRDEMRSVLTKMKGMRSMDGTPAEELPKPAAAPEAPGAVTANPERVEGERPVPERAPWEKLEDALAPGKLASEETLSPAAARDHAVATLKALGMLLTELRQVSGSKILFFLSAGLANDDLADEFEELGQSASYADTRIYALQVPTPARKFADIGRPGLETLARLTGGGFVALGSKPGEVLQRTIAELSFSYLVVIEPLPGQLVGQSALAVKPRRSGVTVRAARWTVADRPLPGATPAAPQAPAPPPSVPPITSAVSDSVAPRWKRDPAVDALVARASEYVDHYWNEMSAVVAEEVYEQRVFNAMTGATAGTRKLVSDFLLVKVPGDVGWMPFRDVFEVDGQQVRERQNRLQKLFLEAPADKAIENGNAILAESARYNIGAIYRNLNVPTLPLMFVHATNVARFEFRKSGEDTLDGMRTWVIEFRETARPTIIKTTTGANVPSTGRFWIEPTSGRITKTTLEAGGAVLTVTYRAPADARDIWFPATMDERYGRSITAKASYSKIRRFQVFTEERIKNPK